jgi:Bifunctional DNA primase/polymerase, N-terminal
VSPTSSPNKDAAMALVSRGLRIFPCNLDKTPMVAAWEQNASNSPFAVSVKWDSAPDALPAVPVGAHGIVVIDCDRKPNRPDGVAAFHALCAESAIDLLSALVVETPSGGLHYYFRTETPYSNSPGSLPDGIDVRGKGGFVIAPGATLPDGRSYKHIAGSWDAIPALPEALAGFLKAKRPTETPVLTAGAGTLAVTDRERAFAKAALADEVAQLTAMREGEGRNRALNEAAHSLGTMNGWIDLNIVADALWEASVANGYVAKDGEYQAKATIESGIIAGMKKPRALLGDESWNKAMKLTIKSWIATYKAKHSISTVQASGKRSVILIQGSEIREQAISWLWDGYAQGQAQLACWSWWNWQINNCIQPSSNHYDRWSMARWNPLRCSR